MFDWERAQDDIFKPAVIGAPPQQHPGTGYLRTAAARWLAPIAVILGLCLAAQSVFRISLPLGTAPVAVASVGGLRAALSGGIDTTMPDDLIAYDDAQFRNFQAGIVRFRDSELLHYAAATARDVQLAGAIMTPYLLDALSLAEREIARRGLQRPVGAMAAEALRQDYLARQADP